MTPKLSSYKKGLRRYVARAGYAILSVVLSVSVSSWLVQLPYSRFHADRYRVLIWSVLWLHLLFLDPQRISSIVPLYMEKKKDMLLCFNIFNDMRNFVL